MVPLPAAAATGVPKVAIRDGLSAALCGDAVFLGMPRQQGSWRRCCSGEIDVELADGLVFTAQGQTVVAVDVESGALVAEYGPTSSPLHSFALSHDGRHLALGAYETVEVVETASGRGASKWTPHRRGVQHLSFSPGDDLVISRSVGDLAVRSLKTWPRRTRRAVAPEDMHGGLVSFPDGRLLGASRADKLGVWDLRLRLEREIAIGMRFIWNVAINVDGSRAAVRGPEGEIAVYSLSDGLVTQTVSAHRGHGALAFLPSSSELVAGDDAALLVVGGQVDEPAADLFVPPDLRSIAGIEPPSALDWDALTVEQVESVASAGWFERVGQPVSDPRTGSIAAWDDWAGPEHETGEAFSARMLAVADPAARAVRGLRLHDLSDRLAAFSDRVQNRAKEQVPYDDERDVWYGPVVAVLEAGYVAWTVAAYAGLGWDVPRDLRVVWGWLENGHWPCALDEDRLVVF